MSDRSKIEYVKRRLRRNYTGADLTSGLIVVGKYYRITTFVTGDDFTNVGAGTPSSRHHHAQVFKATGTTAITWTNSSLLNEILVTTIKNDADIVFESAIDRVTLTSTGFEGGTGSGELTFPRDLLGEALEELIEEFDPGYVTPALIPRKPLGAVVRLGYGCGYGRSGL